MSTTSNQSGRKTKKRRVHEKIIKNKYKSTKKKWMIIKDKV